LKAEEQDHVLKRCWQFFVLIEAKGSEVQMAWIKALILGENDKI